MQTKRKTIRLCLHKNIEASVHEMLILHSKETYIRPHKHVNKSVSYHIIEGEVDVALFDDDGGVVDVISLGAFGSEKRFYYRLDEDMYYLPIVKSEFLLFHEMIQGPFTKSSTIFAPWAVEEGDSVAAGQFQEELLGKVNEFKGAVTLQ